MLGLADSDDYCHAAAVTSNNQIVVLEVVFGQFNLIERPPDLPDDTVGIFNWRRFSLKGKMIEEQYSNVAFPVILEVVFLDLYNYVAVSLAGYLEYIDKRIEIIYSKNRRMSKVYLGNRPTVCQSMLTLFQSLSSPPNDILDGFNVNKFNLINKEFVKFMTVCEDADVGGGVRNG